MSKRTGRDPKEQKGSSGGSRLLQIEHNVGLNLLRANWKKRITDF